jgi:hypothetical protein
MISSEWPQVAVIAIAALRVAVAFGYLLLAWWKTRREWSRRRLPGKEDDNEPLA